MKNRIHVGQKYENIQNALLFHLENLFKNGDEKVDIQFIDYLLRKGIDLNFCDELNENALFKVLSIF